MYAFCLSFIYIYFFFLIAFSLNRLHGYRYSVEKIPLYDSAEDEPSSRLLDPVVSNPEYNVDGMIMDVNVGSEHQLLSTSFVVQSLESVPMEGVIVNELKAEVNESKLYSQDTQRAFSQKNAMISRIQSNTACRNYQIGAGSIPKKKPKQYSNGKLKHLAQKQVELKATTLLLSSKEAQEEVLRYEVLTAVFVVIITITVVYATYLTMSLALDLISLLITY